MIALLRNQAGHRSLVIARRKPRKRIPRRRGTVLLIVLVVVAMLSFGAYSFTTTMLGESRATSMYQRDAQARALADSGVEMIAAVLGDRQGVAATLNLYDDPQFFAGVLLIDDPSPALRGRFSVVAPLTTETTGSRIRYGLIDESGKLNLNTFVTWDIEEEERREMLMMLPGMTIELADSILDWIDEDDEPREAGAESAYYAALDPPYQPRNEPLESLDELLQIRGMTPWLLYGEDANRNGLLDPNENDGEASAPYDDADGTLHPGLLRYFTIHSRETNRMPDGRLRIDVNQKDLARLYDDLLAEFDEETAKFIVAYRLFGPADSDSDSDSGGRSGNSDSSENDSADQQRGGMDLSSGGSQTIDSLYDLVDATVAATISDADQTLESPWKSGGGELTGNFAIARESLGTSGDEFIEGRININVAPREVLLMLFYGDEDLLSLADVILGRQPSLGGTSVDQSGTLNDTSWLLSEGHLDIEDMRTLDRLITARGDVYRAQVVGFNDGGGPLCRLEAVIDATQFPPRILSVRDLTELGRGYGIQHLLPEGIAP